MRLILLLAVSAVTLVCEGQKIIYRIPLKKSNPSTILTYLDSTSSLFQLKFTDSKSLIVFRDSPNSDVVKYEIKSEPNLYEFSRDGDNFYAYFLDFPSDDPKVMTINRNGQPTVDDFVPPAEIKKDKLFMTFTRNGSLYKIYKNNKRNTLSFAEFKGKNARVTHAIDLPEKLLEKITDETYNVIMPGLVDITKLHMPPAYWLGDSVIFSKKILRIFPKYDSVTHVKINFRTKQWSKKAVYWSAKGDIASFLMYDKIFFLVAHPDSLVLEIKNNQTLQSIKKFTMHDSKEFGFRATNFVEAGDTIKRDLQVKKGDIRRYIMRPFYNGTPFIWPSKVQANELLLTIGVQQFYQSGGGAIPGAAGGGTSMYMPTQTSVGPQQYFKGCITDQFEPTECSVVESQQDKALMRLKQLEKIKSNTYAYRDIGMAVGPAHVYIYYIDKKSDEFIVEEF
jgi:hypothetical protein